MDIPRLAGNIGLPHSQGSWEVSCLSQQTPSVSGVIPSQWLCSQMEGNLSEAPGSMTVCLFAVLTGHHAFHLVPSVASFHSQAHVLRTKLNVLLSYWNIPFLDSETWSKGDVVEYLVSKDLEKIVENSHKSL